jgi:hypothetical protein
MWISWVNYWRKMSVYPCTNMYISRWKLIVDTSWLGYKDHNIDDELTIDEIWIKRAVDIAKSIKDASVDIFIWYEIVGILHIRTFKSKLNFLDTLLLCGPGTSNNLPVSRRFVTNRVWLDEYEAKSIKYSFSRIITFEWCAHNFVSDKRTAVKLT